MLEHQLSSAKEKVVFLPSSSIYLENVFLLAYADERFKEFEPADGVGVITRRPLLVLVGRLDKHLITVAVVHAVRLLLRHDPTIFV